MQQSHPLLNTAKRVLCECKWACSLGKFDWTGWLCIWALFYQGNFFFIVLKTEKIPLQYVCSHCGNQKLLYREGHKDLPQFEWIFEKEKKKFSVTFRVIRVLRFQNFSFRYSHRNETCPASLSSLQPTRRPLQMWGALCPTPPYAQYNFLKPIKTKWFLCTCKKSNCFFSKLVFFLYSFKMWEMFMLHSVSWA